MKRIPFLLALLLGAVQAEADAIAYIGTRGAVANEPQPEMPVAHGIYAVRLDETTGRLTAPELQAELERAMWVVKHPKHPKLYAASTWHGSSVVVSFAIDRTTGKLTGQQAVESGGSGATHLVVDPKTATMFVAHFGSGHVTTLRLDSQGNLSEVVSSQQQYGTGPHPRQSAPHAHGVALTPSRQYLLSADMGADRLFIYKYDSATRRLSPAATPFATVSAGSGPRHLVIDRQGQFVYLVNELSAEVIVFRWNERRERLAVVQLVPTYPPNFVGTQKNASEIALSRDGRFLYVSLRGDQNSIVVYAVDQRSGRLIEIQRASTAGKAPWSFAFDPSGRWMLIANEASNSVDVLRVDRRTGLLTPTGVAVSIPRPVTVTF